VQVQLPVVDLLGRHRYEVGIGRDLGLRLGQRDVLGPPRAVPPADPTGSGGVGVPPGCWLLAQLGTFRCVVGRAGAYARAFARAMFESSAFRSATLRAADHPPHT
jgi:hypothetical protein